MDATASDPTQRERDALVAELACDGISSEAVLQAVRRVPRHELVPEALRDEAYENRPLPIGAGQTISQPYVVAFMTQALEVHPGDRVLEIGTGSGYQAAVLAAMGARVFSIEIVPELAERARAALARLGVAGVEVRAGDGYLGWPEEAPFEGIIVTAAAPFVPPAFQAQLAEGGRLVIPVDDGRDQVLEVHVERGGSLLRTRVLPVRFVPMTGEVERVGRLH